ncbi:alpha/beta hydrolase [Parasphingorhabdus pacifica]
MISALAVLSGVAACGQSDPRPEPHTEQRGPAGPVPAGLEKYYGQELSWGPCDEYARTATDRTTYAADTIECARVEVPMDYADPDGRTVRIGLLRKPATDQDDRLGSLLVNPGGPGASGMSSVASLAGTVGPTDLGSRFDLVGIDPRGIGASAPTIRCLTPQERDAERLDADPGRTSREIARTEREERDFAAKCAERTGQDMLAHVGTREVAQDLDVVRSVLGDRRLNYLGYSYGTRIGSEYAERFPGNVRAMLLDGAIDPAQTSTEALVAQGAGFQRAFDDFAEWCADREQCALGNQPEGAVSAYQKLTRPLLDQPVPAGERHLSYSDATTATIQALYAPSLWGRLETGLRELAHGRGETLMALADSYHGRSATGSYSTVNAAFEAVRCVDDQRVMDPAKAREADRRYREQAPFLDDGRGPSPARDACAFWPVPVTGDAELPEVRGLPPVLVVSTTGDPATPYAAGKELASAMRGRLLTFEGTQHTVFLQGNSCVDRAGIDYLVDLELPDEGTRCSN